MVIFLLVTAKDFQIWREKMVLLYHITIFFSKSQKAYYHFFFTEMCVCVCVCVRVCCVLCVCRV